MILRFTYLIYFLALVVLCSYNQPKWNETDTITLSENKINNLPLPFSYLNTLEQLKKEFKGYDVTSYLDFDPADGVQSIVYDVSLKKDSKASFYMNELDSLKLSHIESSSSDIIDQYGIMIGDSFQVVKKMRSNTYTASHSNFGDTYVTFSNSNIAYEIRGETVSNENPNIPALPVDTTLNSWIVTKIVWHKAH